MYVRYTALFTWPRESMSRNRGVISSSNAIAPASEHPVEARDTLDLHPLLRVSFHLLYGGEGLARKLRVHPPRRFDPDLMEVLRAADDLRGDADHDAVPRDLLPLRDDGARSEDRPAADLRPAPDDAPHPDDAVVADLASVDDRGVAHGHAVPDLHGVPEVDVDDRVVLDARALADPDPIEVPAEDRAVPDARVLPDRDVPGDHGGLRDVDHRPGQGRCGLKVFGARFFPRHGPTVPPPKVLVLFKTNHDRRPSARMAPLPRTSGVDTRPPSI